MRKGQRKIRKPQPKQQSSIIDSKERGLIKLAEAPPATIAQCPLLGAKSDSELRLRPEVSLIIKNRTFPWVILRYS